MSVHERERKRTGRTKSYSYQVKWRYRGDGAQQTVTLPTRADAEKVDAWITSRDRAVLKTDQDLQQLVATGRITVAAGSAPTVDSFLTAWEEAAEARDVRKGTRAAYAASMKILREAGVADMDARTVMPSDFRAVLLSMTRGAKPRSPQYRNQVLKRWQRAMEPAWIGAKAVRRDDPFEGVELARVEREGTPARPKVATFLTDAQCATLKAHGAVPEDADLTLALDFLLRTGLRIGEALAARVSDVHKVQGGWCLSVERQRVQGASDVDAPLKGTASYRTVPLPDDLALKLRKLGTPSALIVATATGSGRASVSQDWFRDRLNLVLAAARKADPEFPARVRVHDTRHTYGSNAMNAGVPLMVVQKVMGHSTPVLTANTYGHLDANGHQIMRDAMAS
jgi:integrase